MMCSVTNAFPVSFVDIHHDAGLREPLTSGSESSKQYIIEANGTGVAFVDYDNDGSLDVFLVNGSRFERVPDEPEPTSRLYHNERNGRFIDVSGSAGVARSGWGSGVCAGDYDNDGFIDLYVTYWGPNSLYRNLGNARFADVADRAVCAGPPLEWELPVARGSTTTAMAIWICSWRAISSSIPPGRRFRAKACTASGRGCPCSAGHADCHSARSRCSTTAAMARSKTCRRKLAFVR